MLEISFKILTKVLKTAQSTQKPLVFSPNYRFLLNNPAKPANERPLKSKKLRILNEFKKKVRFSWNFR